MIQGILEQIKGKYFSVFDFYAGFHQFGMTQRARRISAFITLGGHYEYTRMPFGLCNAPATFQRVMNDIFRDKIGKTMQVYLDDVTIYTNTFEEHLKEISEMLRRIKEHGMYLKPQKCTIGAEEIHLLGHIVNGKGLKTDPAKVSATINYPAPTNRTEVKSIMGLINYYHQYIAGCSAVSEPINLNFEERHSLQMDG